MPLHSAPQAGKFLSRQLEVEVLIQSNLDFDSQPGTVWLRGCDKP